MKNYYSVLGIDRNADEPTIRKAFRLNAIKYHPDKHFGEKYFVDKFQEINEAYYILIDFEKKSGYDREWDLHFNTSKQEGLRSSFGPSITYARDTDEEAQFHYNPHKPFYSSQDRFVHETPQFPPQIDHWGNTIDGQVEFLALPKRIGKIISGYSTLKRSDQPLKPIRAAISVILSILIGLAIGVGVIYLFSIENDIWRFIWVVVPTVGLGWLRSVGNTFKHFSNFIGVNGFAEFQCLDSRGNIVKSAEVNFNTVTDLFTRFELRKRNFQYVNTAYQFAWMNSATGEVVYEANALHYDKDGNPPKDQYTTYWLNKEAEKYWTIFLLDKMESELMSKGFIAFNLFGISGSLFTPYIRIGIGYITILKGIDLFTYKFNEIKKIYVKGSDLYIEHINFERVLFFFKSGNADKIPLLNLCNKQFFFKAMEILVGYKFGSS